MISPTTFQMNRQISQEIEEPRTLDDFLTKFPFIKSWLGKQFERISNLENLEEVLLNAHPAFAFVKSLCLACLRVYSCSSIPPLRESSLVELMDYGLFFLSDRNDGDMKSFLRERLRLLNIPSEQAIDAFLFSLFLEDEDLQRGMCANIPNDKDIVTLIHFLKDFLGIDKTKNVLERTPDLLIKMLNQRDLGDSYLAFIPDIISPEKMLRFAVYCENVDVVRCLSEKFSENELNLRSARYEAIALGSTLNELEKHFGCWAKTKKMALRVLKSFAELYQFRCH